MMTTTADDPEVRVVACYVEGFRPLDGRRLVEIAGSTTGGSRVEMVIECDLLHQDALYRLQGELASFLSDVANACGPVQARVLEQKFPFAFERRQEA